MIKCVLIDIDNTVLDFNLSAKEAMKIVFNEYEIQFYEEMFGVFTGINDGLWIEVENGRMTKDELFKVRWNTILNAMNINLDGETFEQKFLKALEVCAVPMKFAEEILEYLSSRYILCAATNAPHEQQLLRLERSGLIKYFDHIFTSGKLGATKPSREFFEECFKALDGVSADESIMIGDSITADIVGGINYGITTCWYNYRNAPAPEGITPDYIIGTLDEIKNIL
ncbi:MAG: YjjG family noncanonical pyrimidine nucleotidase [Eubacteriales bacterium]|nr:YjjG family noncanonical pyrimidine nucleotidase [Eubacteriales bacterium]